jgi:hypothetical protein
VGKSRGVCLLSEEGGGMGLGFVYWFCEKLGKGVWRIMINIFRAITWLSSQLVPRMIIDIKLAL